MTVDGLFATPVYNTIITGKIFNDVQKEISEVYEMYIETNKFHKKLEWESRNHSLSDATFNSNFIEELDLKSLKQVISEHLTHYMGIMDQPINFKHKLFESWMTLTKQNESAIPHAHQEASIAGVYYFKTNHKDGDITFLPPFAQTDWLSGNVPTTFSVEPRVGLLLLFPGWLIHFVKPNETDNDRVSVSFNIKFIKKNFGS